MNDPSTAFDAAFAALASGLACRPRQADDTDFLLGCAIACSPLADLLPHAMLVQQAEFQRAGHDSGFPDAMHRILTRTGKPIGHLRIAWGADTTHLIDIAILPEHQGEGAGTCALRAWLAVADAQCLTATLDVRNGNPAQGLYARLGFVDPNPDSTVASIAMRRVPVRSVAQHR